MANTEKKWYSKSELSGEIFVSDNKPGVDTLASTIAGRMG